MKKPGILIFLANLHEKQCNNLEKFIINLKKKEEKFEVQN